MKESPGRYINPFLSDEENEKLNLWTEEHEHSNTDHDELRNSLEFCEKETELYTDKNVTECELPEFLISYKDGGFHVKDICVDEGTPHGEKILADENNNVMLNPELLKFSTMEDYYIGSDLCSGTDVMKSDTGLPVLEPSNDHLNIKDNGDEVTGNKSVDADLPENGLIGPNELNEVSKDDSNNENGNSKCAPDGFIISSESATVIKATDNNNQDIISVQPVEEKVDDSSDGLSDKVSEEQVVSSSGPTLKQDQLLPSLKSLLDSIDQQPYQSHVDEISKRSDESGNTNILNLKDTKQATTSEHIENLEPVDEGSIESNGASNFQDTGSDKAVAMVNPVHRGDLESSFSVAGHGSQHITYSGPIPFSGSTSLRSDSSTTSTRSFAFPILPNEWNSSPVRMAKADRRRLQKHRGWRNGLLCCRF